MLPSLVDVLALPVVAAARPRVVAGRDRLDQSVRWAHVAEIPEIPALLRGGELILTTGIGLPAELPARLAYLRALAEVPIAGLAVELGRVFGSELPRELVAEAQRLQLPLIELRTEVAFVEVTEAIHAQALDAQRTALQASHDIHQAFTEMAVEGAEPEQILAQVARLSGTAVVLENLGHQVLAHDAAGGDPQRLLNRWAARSRRADPGERTAWDADAGLLITRVGARGQDWGRLILLRDAPPAASDLILIERAAATLALHRLLTRDRVSLERQTHRSILSAVLDRTAAQADVQLRARALGVRLDGRRLLGVVVRPLPAMPGIEGQARLRDLTEAVAEAVTGAGVQALVGALDDATVGLLIALSPTDADAPVLEKLSQAIRGRSGPAPQILIGAGSVVASIREAHLSLSEALQVAQAGAQLNTPSGYLRLPDLRLRGLLHLLADDPRLQTYLEREIGPLLTEANRSPELLEVLRAYLAAGGNKSVTATRLNMSRPTLYERLARISRLLGADLDEVETRLSLQVALLAHDVTHPL